MGMKVSKANVVVVGLDNAGKSTILSRLKPRGVRGQAGALENRCKLRRPCLAASRRLPRPGPQGESFDAAPTVGFEVEVFKKGGLQFTCFDMSGQVSLPTQAQRGQRCPSPRGPRRASTGVSGSSTTATYRCGCRLPATSGAAPVVTPARYPPRAVAGNHICH